ncbi:hypothetical protein RRG08_052786 [Elysia crispata]|uniref:Uncharacterized protein n=1 Tax=Elysia crispata TaxID=231223 RepID=A0AAE1B6J6_9GAST|nr:hypothetical protein RRG08_052786 [Elysia crispata]
MGCNPTRRYQVSRQPTRKNAPNRERRRESRQRSEAEKDYKRGGRRNRRTLTCRLVFSAHTLQPTRPALPVREGIGSRNRRPTDTGEPRYSHAVSLCYRVGRQFPRALGKTV